VCCQKRRRIKGSMRVIVAHFAWEKFWPRVAGWYGIKWKGLMDVGEAGWAEVKTLYDPPLRGYEGPGKVRFRFRVVQWVSRPEVGKAWKELAEKYGLADKS
jgi:hypothetical protein